MYNNTLKLMQNNLALKCLVRFLHPLFITIVTFLKFHLGEMFINNRKFKFSSNYTIIIGKLY